MEIPQQISCFLSVIMGRAQLLAAMTREISVLEFDAGSRLPASRRALQRFLGT